MKKLLALLGAVALTFSSTAALATDEPGCDVCGMFGLSYVGDLYGPVQIDYDKGAEFAVIVTHVSGDGDLFCGFTSSVSPTNYVYSSTKWGSATEEIDYFPLTYGTMYCVVEAQAKNTVATITAVGI